MLRGWGGEKKQRFPAPTRTPGRGALRKKAPQNPLPLILPSLDLLQLPPSTGSLERAASPSRALSRAPRVTDLFGPRSNSQMPARCACLHRGLKSSRRASQLAFPNAAPAPPLLPKAPTNSFPTIINASPSFSQRGSSRKLCTEKRPLAGEGSRAPPCQPLATSHCNPGLLPSLGASLKPRPGLVPRGRNGRFWSLPGLGLFFPPWPLCVFLVPFWQKTTPAPPQTRLATPSRVEPGRIVKALEKGSQK